MKKSDIIGAFSLYLPTIDICVVICYNDIIDNEKLELLGDFSP